MAKYIVTVYDVWCQPVRVEAMSAEEAVSIVADGGGDYLESMEYIYTIDTDLWGVSPDE